MLVLSRREHDKIVFPSLGVAVHVLRLNGNKVRLGVEAPREVCVLRHELEPYSAPVNAEHKAPQRSTDSAERIQSAVQRAQRALAKLNMLVDKDLDASCEPELMELFRQLRTIDEASQSAHPESVTNATPPFVKSRTRALLVEDNINEARLLAAYLRNCSMDVALAGNGSDAIHYLKENKSPDVVLMDMNMPVCDGPSTVKQIRKSKAHQSLRIYAVSGSDPGSYGLELGPRGVDGWFPKPLDPDVLAFRLAFTCQNSPDGEKENDRLCGSAWQHASGVGENGLMLESNLPT